MQSQLTASRKPREQGSPGVAQAGVGNGEGGSRLLQRGGKWGIAELAPSVLVLSWQSPCVVLAQASGSDCEHSSKAGGGEGGEGTGVLSWVPVLEVLWLGFYC